MGKKGKKASHGSELARAGEDGTALLSQGEQLLDAERQVEALACFERVVELLPTNQTAWYHRGVAAAELWEDSVPPEQGQLLQIACTSFTRIFELDTSKRSEARYLSSVALARLQANLAKIVMDAPPGNTCAKGLPPAEVTLNEAIRLFTEAAELQAQWGHEAFDDDTWGAWGEALALQMQLGIEKACGVGSNGPSISFTSDELEAAAALCAAASDKFSKAVTSQIRSDDNGDGDIHWFTLHVEHLLRFVDMMRGALIAPRPDRENYGALWWSQASTAWKEAAVLAMATIQLRNPPSWQSFALNGDVFASAANLLGSVTQVSNTTSLTISLPQSELSTSQLEGLATVIPLQWGTANQELDESQAIASSDAAYSQALKLGGNDAIGAVYLHIGNLRMDLARRQQAPTAQDSLGSAAQAYLSVAQSGLAGSDECVEAWYNLACIAALLGNPDDAADALKSCLHSCSCADEREQTLCEARLDKDLALIRTHPKVAMVLQ